MRLRSERVLRIAHATSAGAGIWLLVGVVALLLPIAAVAQVAAVPVGSTVRITDTGGQRLNLRVGLGRSAAPITSLPEGTVLAVVGPEAERSARRLQFTHRTPTL